MMFRIIALAAIATISHGACSYAQLAPHPRQKPVRVEERQPLAAPLPRPNPRRGAKPGQSVEAPETETPKTGSCLQRLSGLDVSFKPLAAISAGGCGAPRPILLSEVAGVELVPPATVTCDVAESLFDWVTGTVQPAARKRLKTQVTKVHVAASYVCRRRNNQRSGKLSEHGKANALDMSGFSFAKTDAVEVGGGWGAGILKAVGLSANGSFLDDIRKGACKSFTTVLGPGSDRYHGDHFHVDALQRRNGYRICK